MITVKAVRGEHIPGTWRGVCSCGWVGVIHGAKGARSAALANAYQHELTH